MCPPEQCCCCGLLPGVKIGAGLLIGWCVLVFIAVFVSVDENIEAFCNLEHLEYTTDCGETCAVHESGTWFVSDSEFSMFAEDTFPGYSAPPVPIVPLCSSGQGAMKTYTALTQRVQFEAAIERALREGMNAPQAEAACSNEGMTLASIASADENERARKACGDNCCWLGLESASSTKWKDPITWIDGTNFDYANWWPVEQPASWDNMRHVFMNVPGDEPGEHCTALTVHMWLGVLLTLATLGLSCLALVGANSTDGKQLDIVWQGWIALVVVAMIQSFVQTSQTTDMNKFTSPFLAWTFWFIAEFGISLPLSGWWIISVKSLARQCKEGGPAIDSAQPAPADSHVHVAVATAVPAVATAVPVVATAAPVATAVANPVNTTETSD